MRDLLPPYKSEPFVLEYKYDLGDLIVDFDNERKFENHINLAVCWTCNERYKERFYMKPLLVGDEGSTRTVYAATHQAYLIGNNQQPTMEVIVLKDLLAYLANPSAERARQKSIYE